VDAGILFLGFWSVHRILVFSDISGKFGMPVFAVFGLLAGRLGEAAGTLGAGVFTGTPLVVHIQRNVRACDCAFLPVVI
jgi:hypothetical protein